MILTKGEDEKLRRFEKKIVRKIYGQKSSGRSLPKIDELRGPGNIVRRRQCENCKDTDVAMVRPYKRDRRRKSGGESNRQETRF